MDTARPSVRTAAATARSIRLLDGGAWTWPSIRDGATNFFMDGPGRQLRGLPGVDGEIGGLSVARKAGPEKRLERLVGPQANIEQRPGRGIDARPADGGRGVEPDDE